LNMDESKELAAVSLPTEVEISAVDSEERRGEAPIKPEFRRILEKKEYIRSYISFMPSLMRDCSDNEERERGTFKKRPRDPTDDPSTVLCRGVAAGEGCSFEDKCKFSHDVADFLKRRPKDLGDTCPVFAANGYCRYGLNCCYGLSHVDANHVNLGTPADFKATEANDLSMDNRNLLRKSTYPFRSVASTYKKKGGMAKKARDFKVRISYFVG
ncbi:hypothetical protein AaE_005265, partial [Aphanomyces astaci]